MDITTNPQRGLEQTRQRIEQLVHSLAALHHMLVQPPPKNAALPPLSQIQAHISVLSSGLTSLTTSFSTLFPPAGSKTLDSYPTPSFPGATEELLLNQLLTKRPVPAVAEEIAQAEANPAPYDEVQEQLWDRALEICKDVADGRGWGDQAITEEEMEAGMELEETVKRGMRMELAAKERQGRAGRGEEREREMASLLGALRFAGTGVLPAEQTALPRAAAGKK